MLLLVHCVVVCTGPHVGGASVKMMQEMIPVAYESLRQGIEGLQEEVWEKRVPPVMNRDTFWSVRSHTTHGKQKHSHPTIFECIVHTNT